MLLWEINEIIAAGGVTPNHKCDLSCLLFIQKLNAKGGNDGREKGTFTISPFPFESLPLCKMWTRYAEYLRGFHEC